MTTWIRRNVTAAQVAAMWAVFTVLQATLLVWRLVDNDGPFWIGLQAVLVLTGLFLTAASSARFELRDDALRTRTWFSRHDRPWAEVTAIEVDWRRLPHAAAATVSLTDGRTRHSGQWNQLAFPDQAAARDELRHELERTAGAAGVDVTVQGPSDGST